MNPAPTAIPIYGDLDMTALTRELDRTKSELFTIKYASFYGSLLCSHNFYWTPDCETAQVDGVSLMWNPYWFLTLPKRTRLTVLMHELRHPAKLHFIRQGDRNGKIWNYACDIKINNELTLEGFSFEGIEWCWRDASFGPEVAEEEIYDALMAMNVQPQGGTWSSIPLPPHPDDPTTPGTNGLPKDSGDMKSGPMTKDDMAKAVNNVVRAAQQAKQGNQAGGMPGDIEAILTQFLTPVVPWEQVLHKFMQELQENGFTWRKPNRRFVDFYLPSHFEEEGALAHLAYFEDTSGSITLKDALRFNSEFKYVKETYAPKKMTLIQFDMVIQDERVYLEEDPFDQVLLRGGGGTSLVPVRNWILEHRPTAAVVFSDMICPPMEPLDFEIPIIWICISNRSAKVPFGEIVHIR